MRSYEVKSLPVPAEPPPSRRVPTPEELLAPGALDGLATPIWTHLEEADGIATFLWRGTAECSAYISINRVTHTADDSALEYSPRAGLWHASYRLSRQWRGSYAFLIVEPASAAIALEGRALMRQIRTSEVEDPLNPLRTVTHSGVGTSWAQGDRAPAGCLPTSDGAAAHPRDTARLHHGPDGRRVWVVEPAQPRPDSPVVIILDGQVWHDSGMAQAHTRALVAAGRIHPPYLVLGDSVSPAQRNVEMSADGSMAEYVVGELLPWLAAEFGLVMTPGNTVISGESLGGLTALRTVLDYPDQIGNALSQSASLWQNDLSEAIAETTEGRFFVTVGEFETTMLGGHRRLQDAMAGDGRLIGYVEFVGGHDFAWWRDLWAEGIEALLGTPG